MVVAPLAGAMLDCFHSPTKSRKEKIMAQSSTPEASSSRPVNNLVTASVPADWTPGPAAVEPTPFAAAVDRVLHLTAELARNLVGAHQGAATLIVSGDWAHARKWFSLSSKGLILTISEPACSDRYSPF